MPKRTFSKSELNSQSFRSKFVRERNQPVIAGTKVSNPDSVEAKALKMAASLQATGYMSNTNSHVSENDMAEMALGAIGISVLTNKEASKKSYSLLKNIDQQIPLNPAILDPSTAVKLENKSVLAHDKFISSSDPFYVLDEKVSDAKQLETDAVQASTKATRTPEIVASLYDLNASKNTLTLRQFTK
tara:strand:+ start:35260 stop:35820 length:561 start_codon:yes stop_codon:yes gene_type:complete